MRGSGLSLERFIKGKAQRKKTEAKSKKKAIIRKVLRRKEYEKVKRKEGAAALAEEGSTEPTSFYDRFFSELKQEGTKSKPTGRVPTHQSQKPDPFKKAKMKADEKRAERDRVAAEKRKKKEEIEQKVTQRKKRHVKLSMRTASGQPVVRNHINDILAKLEAEQRGDSHND